MVKTPEQYLSELSFTPPAREVAATRLTDAEKAFVEKYLGDDALAALHLQGPTIDVPVVEARQRPVVAAPPAREQTPAVTHEIVTAAGAKTPAVTPEIVTAEEAKTPAVPEKPAPPVTMKDILRRQELIQMVSFYVENQLFLLPVAGIQEVLRHQELVKIPLAPPFVAGAINLRGRVTPLVHLSALLTNSGRRNYGPKNFIIVCGTEQMQIGLIIDKVSSMHMVPQNKIIWNLEAHIGDRGENLCALADLDDKVCGIVAPDMIIQKLLMP